ncbi:MULTISPECIES: MFS transporter [Streptomyces]|uniref:MFS transporter n=1 Tax=Streptomyces TaxID=1883 RepID=UPI000AC82B73|nr:MFS transporter [Streptomyces sp. SID7805]MYU56623.1 MFS transporter [Streptomyces sp. SID7805]
MTTERSRRGGAATAPAGRTATPGSGIPRSLVLLLAAACGLIVANNYYAQPLLPDLQDTFGVSSAVIGLCVTLNQLGYAAGLILVVPLGDLVSRRRLIVPMLVADAVILAAAAAAPGAWALIAALTLAGVTGSVINILIPMTATLADDTQRGRVVGTLMTGLLLGVLLARTVAGALDELAGWRLVYATAAVLIAALTLILYRKLPDLPVPPGSSYPRLLASVASLVRTEPFLRRRMAIGAAGFAAFQLLWTALPFMLAKEPYGYSPAIIGLFGLLGAAGALCAQPAGRLQDRGLAHTATGLLLTAIVASWALLAGHEILALVIAGILLLDVGVQGVHVLNQARIYGYRPQIRSRVTTAYMSAYFLGGSAGGALAVTLYPWLGWPGVCAVGGALGLAAIALWATERVRTAPPAETVPPTEPAEPAGRDTQEGPAPHPG